MKKIFSLFVFISLFLASSCSKNVSSNNLNIFYDSSLNEEELFLKLKDINNFSFFNEQLKGEVILKNSISDSIIQINLDDIEISLKDGWVYIVYNYNGVKIVIKDELDVFLKELTIILNDKDINCDYLEIRNIVYSDIKDVSLDDFERVRIMDELYYIDNELFSLIINSNCLIKEFKYKDKSIYFDYGKVIIDIPVSYDFFPLSIGQAKNLLKIENLSELLLN